MKLEAEILQIFDRARAYALEAAAYLFQSRPCYFSRALGATLLVALFVLGLGLWGNFMRWGEIDFYRGDWNLITGPRLYVLQDALNTGEAPFHISDFMGLKGLTNRYLSIPDMFLSPQAVLLRFLPVNVFILVNIFLLYSVGFVGLLAIKRRFNLSLAVFTILFFLFNFNGSITTHVVVGHFTWLGYFLLPYFALLMIDMPTGRLDWGWILKTCLLLTVIFIQGTFHLYVWCLIFLGFRFIFNSGMRKGALLVIVFSLGLGLFRILPVSMDTQKLAVDFLTGFHSSDQFLRGMVEVVQPNFDYTNPGNLVTHHIAWWEFDFYIGWAGFLFILVFGLYFWLRQRDTLPRWMFAQYAPMLGLFILSIGQLYKPVFMLQIPLLTAERMTSRFWTLPLVFLFFFAAIGLQKFLDQRRLSALTLFGFLGAGLVLVTDLKRHLDLWNLAYIGNASWAEYFDYTLQVMNDAGDKPYLLAIILGSLLSLGFLIFLLVLFIRQRRKK